MKFVKLMDAKGRIVQAALDPEARLAAGHETLSDGTGIEPWAPRELKASTAYTAKLAEERAVKKAGLEKAKAERSKHKKLKRKSQRKNR